MDLKEISHLEWIYNRMVHLHHEDESIDYMIKFHDIIKKLRTEYKTHLVDVSTIGNELPCHTTHKMNDGTWMGEMRFNYRNIQVGSQIKPYYDVYTVYGCDSELDVRIELYINWIKHKK